MEFVCRAHPPGHPDDYWKAGFRRSEMKRLAELYTGKPLFVEHSGLPVGSIQRAWEGDDGDLMMHCNIPPGFIGKRARDSIKSRGKLCVSIGAGIGFDTEDENTRTKVTTFRPLELSLVEKPGIPGADILGYREGSEVYLKQSLLASKAMSDTLVREAVLAAPIVPAPADPIKAMQEELARYKAALGGYGGGDPEVALKAMAAQQQRLQEQEAAMKKAEDDKLREKQEKMEQVLTSPEFVNWLKQRSGMPTIESLAPGIEEIVRNPTLHQVAGVFASHIGNVEKINAQLTSNELRLQQELADAKALLANKAQQVQQGERFEQPGAKRLSSIKAALSGPALPMMTGGNAPLAVSPGTAPMAIMTNSASAPAEPDYMALAHSYMRSGSGMDTSKLHLTKKDVESITGSRYA